VTGALVEYKDRTISVLEDDLREPWQVVLTKHTSYRYENEFRLVSWRWPLFKDERQRLVLDFADARHPEGVNIEADISAMIDAVHVAPNYPKRIVGLVESLLDKYGLTGISVVRSTLLDGPIWIQPRLPPKQLLFGDEDED
jgi:hypothetical protein